MAENNLRRRRIWWPIAALPAAGSFPLDALAGAGASATVAYSLRKLRSNYAGPTVNVRRSSDNTFADIGFRGVRGDFDIQAFTTFVGGGTGFIATWYDQSGNACHATQATTTAQPQISLAATPSGQPAVLVASTAIGMIGTVPAITIPLTLNAVASRTGNLTSFDSTLGFGSNAPAIGHGNTPSVGVANTGIDGIFTASTTDNAFHTITGIVNGASSGVIADGGATTSGTLSNHPGSTQILPATFNAIGLISEAFYFGGVLSAGNIATLTANQKAYWGTP